MSKNYDKVETDYYDGERTLYTLRGKLHRTDGPAYTEPNGLKCWFEKGKFHREDGPAVIFPDGSIAYYVKGKLHREDGPAVSSTGVYIGVLQIKLKWSDIK